MEMWLFFFHFFFFQESEQTLKKKAGARQKAQGDNIWKMFKCVWVCQSLPARSQLVAAHWMSSCSSNSKYTSNTRSNSGFKTDAEDLWPLRCYELGLAWALVFSSLRDSSTSLEFAQLQTQQNYCCFPPHPLHLMSSSSSWDASFRSMPSLSRKHGKLPLSPPMFQLIWVPPSA